MPTPCAQASSIFLHPKAPPKALLRRAIAEPAQSHARYHIQHSIFSQTSWKKRARGQSNRLKHVRFEESMIRKTTSPCRIDRRSFVTAVARVADPGGRRQPRNKCRQFLRHGNYTVVSLLLVRPVDTSCCNYNVRQKNIRRCVCYNTTKYDNSALSHSRKGVSNILMIDCHTVTRLSYPTRGPWSTSCNGLRTQMERKR